MNSTKLGQRDLVIVDAVAREAGELVARLASEIARDVDRRVKALEERIAAIVLTPGPSGASGPAGETGKEGPPGPAGPQGPSGASGQAGPPGEKGATGEPGLPGRDGSDGKAWVPCGTWNGETKYHALDVVVWKGSGWVARIDDPGEIPGPGWQMFAQKGSSGPQGEKGTSGQPGPRGKDGIGLEELVKTDDGRTVWVLTDGRQVEAA
jgi:hypothetical protein